MSTKRMLLVVLVIGAVLLAVGIGPRVGGKAQASPPVQESDPAGLTIPYPGRLNGDDGQAATDGAYDFTFALYDAPTGGEMLWSEAQEGVTVKDGAFATMLGRVQGIPPAVLEGKDRWLEVGVRGPGESEFTALTPRQRLNPVAPSSPSGGAACPHDHFNEWWSGGDPDYGLTIENGGTGDGIRAYTNSPDVNYAAVWGYNYGTGPGLLGRSAGGDGVAGTAYTSDKSGVYGNNVSDGYGVTGRSDSGVGVNASSGGGAKDHAALRADNWNATNGMAAYFTNKSAYHTAHFQNTGNGGVLFLQNNGDANGAGGDDFITAVNSDGSDVQFRVASDGAAYSDGGWHIPADYAELMTTEGNTAAYEPGDVLVISAASDRSAALSSQPYSTLVLGVYSEKPGIAGSSHPMEGQREDEIPVAIVGIVPCKVSAENGPISRGDLLVTSSTPGHAMRADNPPPGTILGKALEPLDAGIGVILVLVTLQ